MRTTLTIDPDVARLLDDEVHRRRRPFKQVVNDAIRRGLAPRTSDARARLYRVRAQEGRLRPGVDPAALNRLADELEDEAVLGKQRR